jgi:predicted nuclease of predicted toxin-antitoxin system
MKILIDMNLSPSWKSVLLNSGIHAVHWIEIGKPNASDSEILNWATLNNFIVFSHDLDFGAILAIYVNIDVVWFFEKKSCGST